jgi:hypothetical protein
MTTFGDTNIEANQLSMSSYNGCGWSAVLSDNGANITKISVYMAAQSGTVSAYGCIMDTSGNVKATSSIVTGITTTPGWVDFPLTVTLDSGTYFLGITMSSSVYIYNDGTFNGSVSLDTWVSTYPSIPNPASLSVWNNQTYSFYGTYTTGGGTPVSAAGSVGIQLSGAASITSGTIAAAGSIGIQYSAAASIVSTNPISAAGTVGVAYAGSASIVGTTPITASDSITITMTGVGVITSTTPTAKTKLFIIFGDNIAIEIT